MNKLRQKELTQSFINKPCSLYITDRALKIVDRMSQVKILNHFVSFLFVDRTFSFLLFKECCRIDSIRKHRSDMSRIGNTRYFKRYFYVSIIRTSFESIEQ